MKHLFLLLSALLLAGCTSNAQTITPVTLEIKGESLPAIRHITDMKMVGDTLLFAYETEDSYGQRFLRSAMFDKDSQSLMIGADIGKRADGYYVSYMPYPFINSLGSVQVISQDDCEIYDLSFPDSLVGRRQNILDGESTLPFPLSQYVQDVYAASTDNYVFIGREPNGGSQYAMKANTVTHQVDTICKIAISSDLQTWMPNAGEMAYSNEYNRIAFAYRLHPVIDLMGMYGNLIKQIRLAPDTFDPKTLEQADFDDLNPLHTVDISVAPDYIYALIWGCKYSDVQAVNPTILKTNWNGNIVDKYTVASGPLYKIAVSSDNNLIGWNGTEFILLKL